MASCTMLAPNMVPLAWPAIPARIVPWLFGALVLLVAPKAQAWGDDGHRVVGELAFRHLTPSAQAAVSQALTEPGYRTLAEAATWPDTYARRFPEFDPMKPLHYVNVDPRAPSYRRERDCPNGCVVTALEQFVSLLGSSDPPLSVTERRRALYWIAHFVGDIHQPLHIAHPDGKGGMATFVKFFEVPDKRYAHWIWDVGLIERRPPPPTALADRIASDQPTYRALADQLALQLTPEQRRRWQRVVSAQQMANEGLLLARRHAYLQSSDHVDERYLTTRWPIVAEQLQRAGLRLAAILNQAFGS
jgi:hypothetical protein